MRSTLFSFYLYRHPLFSLSFSLCFLMSSLTQNRLVPNDTCCLTNQRNSPIIHVLFCVPLFRLQYGILQVASLSCFLSYAYKTLYASSWLCFLQYIPSSFPVGFACFFSVVYEHCPCFLQCLRTNYHSLILYLLFFLSSKNLLLFPFALVFCIASRALWVGEENNTHCTYVRS